MNREQYTINEADSFLNKAGVTSGPVIEEASKMVPADVMESIKKVVDYLYEQEERNYNEMPDGQQKEGHIFMDVQKVVDFLGGKHEQGAEEVGTEEIEDEEEL